MIGWLVERSKMVALAGKWFDATNLNPGDSGQIATFASNLIKSQGCRVEDAWLTGVVNWTFNCPAPEFRFLLANGILRFLDIYEHSAGLSPESRDAAREVAENIIGEGILNGYPSAREKNYFGDDLIGVAESEIAPVPQKKLTSQTSLAPPLPAPNDISPSGKNGHYLKALHFVIEVLSHQGFQIHRFSENRADSPSLIANKNGVCFHVQLEASVYPAKRYPAPFVIQRLARDAENAGAHCRIARVTLYNNSAKTEDEKSSLHSDNIGFLFDGLEPTT
ncbi:MAG: hypothetical protein Q7J46_14300 [Pseudomonas sp.]|nr:hypothetical protein [Pseudomonas sp.]